MAQRILYGNISANGTKYSGSPSWSVRKTDQRYSVTFDPPFTTTPTVVLTQNYPDWGGGTPGSTLDNAVLNSVSTTGCEYYTGGSGGDRQDRNCGFIAIGEA